MGGGRVGNATATQGSLALEPFEVFAHVELARVGLAEAGRCAHPDCQRAFDPARAWQRYCCADCRRADTAEFRAIGHRAAPALLAHRLGKYTARGASPEADALRALSAAGRRYLGILQSEWLRDRLARAEVARGRA